MDKDDEIIGQDEINETENTDTVDDTADISGTEDIGNANDDNVSDNSDITDSVESDDAVTEDTDGDNIPDDAADLIRAADLNTAAAEDDEDDGYTDISDDEFDDAEDTPSEPLPEDDLNDEEIIDEQDAAVPAKRRVRLFRPILFVIIVCFCIIAAADIIAQQNEIEQLEQETVMMTGKIEETKQKNDEYTALLEADEDEFMERVAVEQLGYSYPNERRYYIVNKSEE
ncbi:septum formation initiator family protein [uncultured Ruminococcus sp.]|uniref:FtsB family cell division protein n=1 Tax=uncultured Ruminococcus sp. TaxID=165186 RepID=UPI0025DA6451|nr:septum formation initiator [uncultured Ruminococcus sp.]